MATQLLKLFKMTKLQNMLSDVIPVIFIKIHTFHFLDLFLNAASHFQEEVCCIICIFYPIR